MKIVAPAQFESIPVIDKVWNLTHRGKTIVFHDEQDARSMERSLSYYEAKFDAQVQNGYFWKFFNAVRKGAIEFQADDSLNDFPSEFSEEKEDAIFWQMKEEPQWFFNRDCKRFYNQEYERFYDSMAEAKEDLQDSMRDGAEEEQVVIIDLDTDERFMFTIIVRTTFETIVEKL